MTGIIDVHSHIITNLGSAAPMDKLPLGDRAVLSLMDAEWNRRISLIAPESPITQRTEGLPTREANQ